MCTFGSSLGFHVATAHILDMACTHVSLVLPGCGPYGKGFNRARLSVAHTVPTQGGRYSIP
jgi:hypothetical protein